MNTIQTLIQNFSWTTTLDVLIVFLMMFGFMYLIKTTRATNLIKVIVCLFCLYALSHFLHLTILKWVLERFSIVFVILVVIIFQPELRRAFEKIRRGQFFTGIPSETLKNPVAIKQILTTIDTLAKQKIGALIVLELNTNLDEYIESGVPINGQLTSDLLVSLFWPGAPTHDGAVVIRENRITAAGCLLPLTDAKIIDRRLGTRHRSALGLTELSDALVLVVSEETGTISIAEQGNMTRYLNREALETRLFRLYKDGEPKEEAPREVTS